MIKIKQPRLVGTRLETPRITANELHKSRWDGTGSEQAFCMFSLRTARADALPKNQLATWMLPPAMRLIPKSWLPAAAPAA